MKCTIVFLVYLTVCRADDLASTAGQTFDNILPSLIKNQSTSSDGNSTQITIQQIGTVVDIVLASEDYSKEKSYANLLKKVQDSTTDEDLLRVSEEMFNADINNAFNYIKVNLQGLVWSTMSNSDNAPTDLLTVSDNVWNGPTIKPLVALFDNYDKNVTRPEFKKSEQTTYINTILATGPIRSLMSFLVNKGLTQLNEYQEQVELLRKIWFSNWTSPISPYKYSCAFENIFMGQHSWLLFAKREQDRKANYLGYFYKRDLAGKGLLLMQHYILSEMKDPLTVPMFVGTSPELEIALYTLCFMARPDLLCKQHYHNVTFYIHAKPRWTPSKIVKFFDTAFPVLQQG